MLDPDSTYRFAGICVASALTLPELPRAQASLSPRFAIRVAADPVFSPGPFDWQHDWLDPNGAVTLIGARIGRTGFLRVPGIADARLDADGQIALWRDPQASIESVRHALIDQILPRALAHHGELVLHGAAVVIDADHSLVILGQSGFGKSTLTAAFAKQHRVLTDDCLLLRVAGEGVRVVPTYPGLRLLPDSLAALYGADAPPTQAVAHYTDKRRLAPVDVDDTPAPPVAAIMILEPPASEPDVRISLLAPGPACMAVLGQAFQFDLGDMHGIARLMARSAAVVDQVRVSTLAYPREYALLPTLIERLCAQVTGHL